MGAHVRGLASEAWRDEDPRHSAGAGAVPVVELACMLVGLERVSYSSITNLWTYVASGPSVAMRTWLLNGGFSSNKL